MIEARGLTKRFGGTLAVDDLSFIVDPGMVTGFLGPNGAGKSTTMRMILGLDHPASGSVTVNGKPYQQLAHPMREVGALLDTSTVHGGRSAYHHLLCLAQTNGLPKRRVHEMLELVGITEMAGKRIGGFSLGMRQRLGIAAALLGDPQTLIFDEPVNGLDPDGVRWVRSLMKSLAAEGRTVLVSSHLMSEMQNMADQLIVIGRGRLIADCSVSAFIARHSVQAIRVRTPQAGYLAGLIAARGGRARLERGTDGDDALLVQGMPQQAIGDLAFDHRVRVRELALARASLEEAFMELTTGSVEYQAGGSASGRGAPVNGAPAGPGRPRYAVMNAESARQATAGSGSRR